MSSGPWPVYELSVVARTCPLSMHTESGREVALLSLWWTSGTKIIVKATHCLVVEIVEYGPWPRMLAGGWGVSVFRSTFGLLYSNQVVSVSG
jgi:hypothetical protein